MLVKCSARVLAVQVFSSPIPCANFFGYMREHYSLDRLIEYGTEPFAGRKRQRYRTTCLLLLAEVREQLCLALLQLSYLSFQTPEFAVDFG